MAQCYAIFGIADIVGHIGGFLSEDIVDVVSLSLAFPGNGYVLHTLPRDLGMIINQRLLTLGIPEQVLSLLQQNGCVISGDIITTLLSLKSCATKSHESVVSRHRPSANEIEIYCPNDIVRDSLINNYMSSIVQYYTTKPPRIYEHHPFTEFHTIFRWYKCATVEYKTQLNKYMFYTEVTKKPRLPISEFINKCAAARGNRDLKYVYYDGEKVLFRYPFRTVAALLKLKKDKKIDL